MQQHDVFNTMWDLIPLIAFTPLAIRACVIDFQEHRLPNKLTFGITVATVIAMFFGTIIIKDSSRVLSAVLCGFGSLILFLILHLISKGSLGLGDVKFSFPCGLVVGWFVPNGVLYWLWWSFGSAALVALVGVVMKKISLKQHLPFGPFMLFGLFVTLLTS